jgi:phage major head subunit gpT-like protein
MKRKALAVVALALSTTAAAQVTPDEQRWIDAFQPVWRAGKSAGISSTVAVISDARKGSSPVAARWIADKAQCQLVLQVRGNPFSKQIIAGVAQQDVPAVLEAIMAHEFAHCMQGRADVRYDSEVDYEAQADLFALVWTQQRNPQHLSAVFEFFLRLRGIDHDGSGSHNTRAVLARTGIPQATPDADAIELLEITRVAMGK